MAKLLIMDLFLEIHKLLEKEFEAHQSLMEALVDAPVEEHAKLTDEFESFREANQLEIEKLNQKIQDQEAFEEPLEEEVEEEVPQSELTRKFIEYRSKYNDDCAKIAKKFKESELIEIAKDLGFELNSKGTKLEKVELIKKEL